MKPKKILAALLSVSMLSAAPAQLLASAETTEDIVLLSTDITGSTVKLASDGTVPKNGVLIHASYSDDGSLKALETKKIPDTSDNVELDFAYSLGDKLFVWNSLTDMTPYETDIETDFLVSYAKVQDLGWSQFVVAQFEDGYSLENTTLTVDGTDVTEAFTPVTTDGSIVKWEITSLNPAKLMVTNTEKGTQTITLSDNKNQTATAVKKNTTAGYMIAHGPMAIWDYYLSVYDKEGAIRVEPKETTINLTGAETTDAPAAYSPEAQIKTNGTGTVEIMFNYNKDWEKTWFDAVKNQSGSVELVTYDENKYVLNNHLTFTKTANVTHGSGKVGEIKIALGQDNFKTNGRYYIRVRSEGHDSALVPIHVVNETAPTLSVTAGSEIRSGENVTFKIGNMVYGITNPTYAAELTRPDGKTLELEMITDWYQIGDNLYLYNTEDADGIDRNKIPYKGEYTLTVHSNGFKDMSETFTVSQGEEIPVTANLAAYGIDMMSSATYSGSVSGDSSSGTVGGGQQVSADVKFNADLLINAMIIAEQLGIENDSAQAICDRWNSMTPDSVSAADTTLGGFDWNAYYSAVSRARHEGKYLSFADYANNNFDSEKTTVPHAVKSVLENNLLGDIQYDAAWVGRDCPFMALVKRNEDGEWEYTDKVMAGEDINIICYGTEYLSAISSVNLNGNSSDLTKDTDYTLSVSQDSEYMLLTIKTENQSLLNVNNTNTVTLKAPKYKTNTLYIPYEKEMEQNLSLATDKTAYTRGENETDVVITVTNSEGDFLIYLDKIEITTPDGDKKNALSAAAGGTSSYYYEKTGSNTVTLTDSKNTLFADNGGYTIKLIPSQYYNALETTVTINGELKTVPNDDPYIYSVDDDTYSVTVKHYLVDFGGNNKDSGLDAWKNAIKSVTINGTEYAEGTLARDKYTWPTQSGNDVVMELYGLNAFKDNEENTIVIKATGYDDLTLKFTSLEARTAPTFKAKLLENGKYRITFNGTDAEINKFLKRLETVTVGETRYFSSGISDNSIYALVKDEESGLYTALDLAPNAVNEYGTTAVKITAKGYTNLDFEIDNGERPIIDPPSVDEESLKTKIEAIQYGDTDHYHIAFTGDTDKVDAYLAAVTAVTVGEASYKDIENSYYSSLSSSLYRRTKDGGAYKYLDIAANAIPDYEVATEITVTATGYNDLKFTIDNTAKHMPSAPVVNGNTKVYGTPDYYRLTFDGTAADISDYLNAIDTVTVGEDEYGSASSFYTSITKKYKLGYDSESGKNIYLDLTADGISADSTTKITVTANGYKDLEYTIDNTDFTPDTAPELDKIEYTESSSDYSPSYYTLSFKETTDGEVDVFLGRITSVTVGGTEYSSASYFFGKNTKTYVINNDNTLSVTDDCVVSYDGDTAGETAVVIKAKDYTDKTYTIVVNPPANTPEIDGDAENKTDYYRVAFIGGAADIDAYLNSIKTVTVGSKSYTLTTDEITTETTQKYKLSKVNAEDDNYAYLDLSADGVAEAGVTNITIEASGYKSLTFTIGSEETGKDAPAFDTAAFIENSAKDYYSVSFKESVDIDGDYISDYIGSITSVTVGGRTYSKAAYNSQFYSSDNYSYRLAYDSSKTTSSYDYNLGYIYTYYYTALALTADGIPQYGEKTEVTVTAEGYKTLKFTIDNSENQPAAAPEVSGTKLTYSETKDYYKISFVSSGNKDENLRNYISKITGVTVGETGYSKAYYNNSFYANENNCYTYLYDESGYDSSYNTVYYFNAVAVTDDAVDTNAKTTVTISSKGYEDLTLEIDTTNIILDTPPAVDKSELSAGYSTSYHDWYCITFTSNAETDEEKEAEISEFLSRITSVTVGENKYDKTTSSSAYKSSDSYLFRIAHASSYSYSGSYVYLYMTTDGFSSEENTSVTVNAKGYNDLTFTIDAGGNLVTE